MGALSSTTMGPATPDPPRWMWAAVAVFMRSHFEHVAHLRFVDLDLGLTPVRPCRPGLGTSFSLPQRLLEGLGGGFVASGVLGRVQSQCQLCL